ncbi:MAG: membrane protein [Candidatus Tectimicrobiota bacterium]|nr:MAG: membrane protein [Candidatus Tectomicrobia bacterium]
MKRWAFLLTAGLLAGVLALPALADDRLKVTGFIDTHMTLYSNVSPTDDNFTDGTALGCKADGCDEDDSWHLRTRGRIFFNVAATENTKAVIAFEIDQAWGQNTGIPGTSAPGFDIAIDNTGVTELKQMYVDAKLPGLPVRLRAGGFYLINTRLKQWILWGNDVAAVALDIDFHPQVKALVYFAPTQEDFDELLAGGRLGEDYLTGVTLQTTPMKGLDVDFIVAFQHLQAPSFGGADGNVRVFPVAGLKSEDRWYLGVDARWKMGNFSFDPTFIYAGGTREFTAGADADISAFLLDVRASYSIGPFTLTGKFVFNPGNEATDDLGPGSDINTFRTMGTDTVHKSSEWFQILGWNLDTTSPPSFGFGDTRSIRVSSSFDQFGLIHGAVLGQYKATPKITLNGAVGFFSAAEDVGRPARLGPAVASTAAGSNFNYTGEDKYIGTEIDLWVRYNIFPNTSIDVWFAHAFIGDALNLRHPDTGLQEAQDATAGGTRMIYRF